MFQIYAVVKLKRKCIFERFVYRPLMVVPVNRLPITVAIINPPCVINSGSTKSTCSFIVLLYDSEQKRATKRHPRYESLSVDSSYARILFFFVTTSLSVLYLSHYSRRSCCLFIELVAFERILIGRKRLDRFPEKNSHP